MAKNRPYDGKNARALLLLPLCGVKKKALFGDGAYPPWADTAAAGYVLMSCAHTPADLPFNPISIDSNGFDLHQIYLLVTMPLQDIQWE